MKILVIGTGYVGTTTGLVFAEWGHHVTGIDIDPQKIEQLNNGRLHFYEKGLEELLKKHLSTGHITFSGNLEQAVKENDLIFICVGTPSLPDGRANLQFLEQVSKEIGKCLHEFKVIVVKSTVPVGTSDKVKQWIKESCSQADDFAVVSNPEFLREGSALYDALQPDRIVIGSDCRQAITILNKLYEQACCPILITSSSSAELIKYASNSFLALKISFVNELAKLCDHLEIDIQGVAEGMGLDHRIGEHFLQAGIGYGGSCFPKDVDALLHTSKKHGVDLTILEKVVEVNKTQPLYMIEKIRNMLGSLKEKKVGILGLAFKPHTDDLRESPSLKILQVLDEEKAIVQVHDPVATLPSSTFSSHITQCETPYLAATDADAILICTDWPEYRQLDWKKINKLLKHPYLFDGRNMLDAHMLSQLGFLYEGVGKKSGVHSSTLL